LSSDNGESLHANSKRHHLPDSRKIGISLNVVDEGVGSVATRVAISGKLGRLDLELDLAVVVHLQDQPGDSHHINPVQHRAGSGDNPNWAGNPDDKEHKDHALEVLGVSLGVVVVLGGPVDDFGSAHDSGSRAHLGNREKPLGHKVKAPAVRRHQRDHPDKREVRNDVVEEHLGHVDKHIKRCRHLKSTLS
jgi:hypothetical protein